MILLLTPRAIYDTTGLKLRNKEEEAKKVEKGNAIKNRIKISERFSLESFRTRAIDIGESELGGNGEKGACVR